MLINHPAIFNLQHPMTFARFAFKALHLVTMSRYHVSNHYSHCQLGNMPRYRSPAGAHRSGILVRVQPRTYPSTLHVVLYYTLSDADLHQAAWSHASHYVECLRKTLPCAACASSKELSKTPRSLLTKTCYSLVGSLSARLMTQKKVSC